MGSQYVENFAKKYNLEAYLDNSIYIMKSYIENDEIKGFIIANLLCDSVEILLIYVQEKNRKCGIATKLLLELEKNNVDNLLLEVSILNIPAINLYKKLGYSIISTRSKYYNGVDAYIMKKVLK